MRSASPRPPGFVHVDLDGLWTLAGVYGFPEQDLFELDPVFNLAVDRLLELLGSRGIRATFFIVGRDLELPEKVDAVARIAAAGHRLANHSLRHDLRLGEAAPGSIEEELRTVNERLSAVAGEAPLGFRAPGYAVNERVLTACVRAGLRYDGSVFPCWWAPLLRRLAGSLRQSPGPPARGQYGGGGSLRPRWERPVAGAPPILRLPVAVSPRLRLPLHASLGLLLGAGTVRRGLRNLAARGLPAVYLLHGLDLLGAEEFAGRLPGPLAGHRAFRPSLASKREFLDTVLRAFGELFAIETTEDWMRRLEVGRSGGISA
ncbi:MAG TPA: polysaccharide deacetylase family protein [Candidatus Sumerlaeota bacterium]|nr:polysaccharide deacetylase family protein [Candidatus Sumerlaeota bacterium]